MKIIHLITPGIDSMCAYFYILERVSYFDIELVHVMLSPKYFLHEYIHMTKMIKYLKHPVKFIDDSSTRMILDEREDGFIPSRNLYLTTLLDITGLPDRVSPDNIISFGFNSDDRVYDSSNEYCENVTKLLSSNVRMGSLVRHLSKKELLKWFIEESKTLTGPEKYDLIQNTYSCYTGEESECLACNACFRKSTVLNSLGVETRKVNDLDFLRVRLNILKENVPPSRKDDVLDYIKNLIKIQPEVEKILTEVTSEGNY